MTSAASSRPVPREEQPRELRLELLVGCTVHAAAGECIGRVEELRAEVDGADYVVREFHVGKVAVVERLFGGGRMVRALARHLSGGRLWSGYVVPWEDMDLSDPRRPRVRRRAAELARLEE